MIEEREGEERIKEWMMDDGWMMIREDGRIRAGHTLTETSIPIYRDGHGNVTPR